VSGAPGGIRTPDTQVRRLVPGFFGHVHDDPFLFESRFYEPIRYGFETTANRRGYQRSPGIESVP